MLLKIMVAGYEKPTSVVKYRDRQEMMGKLRIVEIEIAKQAPNQPTVGKPDSSTHNSVRQASNRNFCNGPDNIAQQLPIIRKLPNRIPLEVIGCEIVNFLIACVHSPAGKPFFSIAT